MNSNVFVAKPSVDGHIPAPSRWSAASQKVMSQRPVKDDRSVVTGLSERLYADWRSVTKMPGNGNIESSDCHGFEAEAADQGVYQARSSQSEFR